MKKKIKRKGETGITLIALIITIIVLLILAGVSISMVVGDNGILSQAVNATTATDVADVKEQIQLALIGYLDSNGDYTLADVEQAVADAGATLGEDGVTVTTAKGNTFDISDIVAGAGVSWEYTTNDDGELAVTNGTDVLTVGDVVNYNEQTQTRSGAISTYTSKASTTGMDGTSWGNVDQVFTLSNNNVGWVVLGADEDTGELLIVSDAIVYSDSASAFNWDKGWYALCGRTGYANAVSEMNNICKMFGYGTGASGARVLDQDDVDKVFGFDLETTTLGSDYTGAGEVWEAGATVTVSWAGNSNTYPTYKTSSLISESLEDSLNYNHSSGFYWYDEDDGWQYSAVATGDAETIATIENKYIYWYYGSDLADTDSAVYKMIFISDSEYYFLGSAFSCVYAYCGCWGLCDVSCSGCTGGGGSGLAYSYGYEFYDYAGFRPVVSLSSNITLEGNSTDGWSIK